jgi:hypothetical protein
MSATMSASSFEYKKGSEVDEKSVEEISNGLAVTIAEDTVEAAHECMLNPFPSCTTLMVINLDLPS